jgi:zinc-binding alcohol dehydrogenase family protein
MKAVGYRKSLPISDPQSLIDVDIEAPRPGPRDLRVSVKAISVNPVDTKVRMRAAPKDGEPPKVLGFDAAGVVESAGADVTLFKPGDEVFYAGSIIRPGTNSELHLVDERIVGRKPKSLSFAQAAALPLTSITAWEILFDRFCLKPGGGNGGTVLALGGAGGVGSIFIQLARHVAGLTVFATASRPETREWCLKLGTHHIIDHTKPFADQMKGTGHAEFNYVGGLTFTEQHYPQFAPLFAPQAKLAIIDDPAIDFKLGKGKSISYHWESMFTRSMFMTPDMIEQHRLLDAVSKLVDDGTIKTTLTREMGTINAANLRAAHALIESGTSIGKVVLSGW